MTSLLLTPARLRKYGYASLWTNAPQVPNVLIERLTSWRDEPACGMYDFIVGERIPDDFERFGREALVVRELECEEDYGWFWVDVSHGHRSLGRRPRKEHWPLANECAASLWKSLLTYCDDWVRRTGVGSAED